MTKTLRFTKTPHPEKKQKNKLLLGMLKDLFTTKVVLWILASVLTRLVRKLTHGMVKAPLIWYRVEDRSKDIFFHIGTFDIRKA